MSLRLATDSERPLRLILILCPSHECWDQRHLKYRKPRLWYKITICHVFMVHEFLEAKAEWMLSARTTELSPQLLNQRYEAVLAQ